jgi:hypothetical protein
MVAAHVPLRVPATCSQKVVHRVHGRHVGHYDPVCDAELPSPNGVIGLVLATDRALVGTQSNKQQLLPVARLQFPSFSCRQAFEFPLYVFLLFAILSLIVTLLRHWQGLQVRISGFCVAVTRGSLS